MTDATEIVKSQQEIIVPFAEHLDFFLLFFVLTDLKQWSDIKKSFLLLFRDQNGSVCVCIIRKFSLIDDFYNGKSLPCSP